MERLAMPLTSFPGTVWKDLKLASPLEKRLVEARLNPDVAFGIARDWILVDGLAFDAARERLDAILENFAAARDAGVRIANSLDHRGPSKKSTRELFAAWKRLAPALEPIDWTAHVRARESVTPAYLLHPAKERGEKYGTPVPANGEAEDVDLRTRAPAPPRLVRAPATRVFGGTRPELERLTVSGVGEVVRDPVATVLAGDVRAVEKRIARLRRERARNVVVGLPRVADALSERGLAAWPAKFLEARAARWRELFARRLVEWFLETDDLLERGLVANGWTQKKPTRANDPALPGNDVRVNALAKLESGLAIPLAREAWRFVTEANLFELPLAAEEAEEALAAYLDAVLAARRRGERALPAEAALARDAFRAARPPGLREARARWLRLRGFEGEADPLAGDEELAWLADVAAGGQLAKRSLVLDNLTAFLREKFARELTAAAREATREMPRFFDLHVEARKLRDDVANLDAVRLRRLEELVSASDPTYELLVRLAAHPGTWQAREAALPRPRDALESELREVVAKYYSLPLGTPLIEPAVGTGVLPSELWFRRLSRGARSFAPTAKEAESAAEHELALAKEGLARARGVREVDATTKLARRSRSPVVLEAAVTAWPPPTAELRFVWKKRAGFEDETLPEERFDAKSSTRLASRREVSPEETGGDHSCVVEAFDDAGKLVARGESRVRTISRVARCVRCRAVEFDVDRVADADAEGAPVFSESCTWRAALRAPKPPSRLSSARAIAAALQNLKESGAWRDFVPTLERLDPRPARLPAEPRDLLSKLPYDVALNFLRLALTSERRPFPDESDNVEAAETVAILRARLRARARELAPTRALDRSLSTAERERAIEKFLSTAAATSFAGRPELFEFERPSPEPAPTVEFVGSHSAVFAPTRTRLSVDGRRVASVEELLAEDGGPRADFVFRVVPGSFRTKHLPAQRELAKRIRASHSALARELSRRERGDAIRSLFADVEKFDELSELAT